MRLLKLGTFLTIVVAGMLLIPTVVMSGGMEKATICHIPPGNPENAATKQVSQSALDTHLAHGDVLGGCDAAPDTPVTGTISCFVGIGNGGSWSTSVDPARVEIVMVTNFIDIIINRFELGEFDSPGIDFSLYHIPPVGTGPNFLELWLDGALLDSCLVPY